MLRGYDCHAVHSIAFAAYPSGLDFLCASSQSAWRSAAMRCGGGRHLRFLPSRDMDTHSALEFGNGCADRTACTRSARSRARQDDLPGLRKRVLATFAVTMAHSREALFAIAICAVFLAMYLGVPRIFLGVEPKVAKCPSFDAFLYKGLETYTGHCSGKDALLQMLLVPVLLTLCGFAMGIIALSSL